MCYFVFCCFVFQTRFCFALIDRTKVSEIGSSIIKKSLEEIPQNPIALLLPEFAFQFQIHFEDSLLIVILTFSMQFKPIIFLLRSLARNFDGTFTRLGGHNSSSRRQLFRNCNSKLAGYQFVGYIFVTTPLRDLWIMTTRSIAADPTWSNGGAG